ncbi:hypothetical protein Tco_1312195 [Tanacetum coccineum]
MSLIPIPVPIPIGESFFILIPARRVSNTLTILAWWKKRGNPISNFISMARDLLNGPASSIGYNMKHVGRSILEDVEETIEEKKYDIKDITPNTELDEGEFEDLDIEHVDVEDFLEDLMD